VDNYGFGCGKARRRREAEDNKCKGRISVGLLLVLRGTVEEEAGQEPCGG